MSGLELIKKTDGQYYWYLDYRYEDNSGGRFVESINYKTDKEAIQALTQNKIIFDKDGAEGFINS